MLLVTLVTPDRFHLALLRFTLESWLTSRVSLRPKWGLECERRVYKSRLSTALVHQFPAVLLQRFSNFLSSLFLLSIMLSRFSTLLIYVIAGLVVSAAAVPMGPQDEPKSRSPSTYYPHDRPHSKPYGHKYRAYALREEKKDDKKYPEEKKYDDKKYPQEKKYDDIKYPKEKKYDDKKYDEKKYPEEKKYDDKKYDDKKYPEEKKDDNKKYPQEKKYDDKKYDDKKYPEEKKDDDKKYPQEKKYDDKKYDDKKYPEEKKYDDKKYD